MTEISDEMCEQLRQILEKQNERTYTFKEAKEIGDGLVDFYQILINMETDTSQEDNQV